MSRKLLMKLTMAGIGLCLLLIVASFFVDLPYATWSGPAQQYNPGGDFTLTDTNGKVFHLKDLRGEIVLLFFGYIYCPDACPGTLAKIHQTLALLDPAQRKQVRTVFVSVDPERDKPDIMKDYLDYFSVNAIGLSGTKEQIDKVVKAYHAHYQIIPDLSGSGYTISHTTTVYLHDSKGKVRHLLLFEDSSQQMAEQIRRVL